MRSLSLATLVASLVVFSGISSAADPFGQCDGEGFEASACPADYKCSEINTSYFQCLPEHDDSHLVDPAGEDTHELRKRQTQTRVTGPTLGATSQRLAINWLQSQRPSIFNMATVGLFEVMRVSEGNILSYYELAGIHGAPFKAWQETSPANPPQMGYCTHASALFATWHRPYLSLLEQRIQAHAVAVAARFTGSNAAAWRDAATRVRLPYWDWSSSDLRGALPTVITQPTIQVAYPGSNGTPYIATIYNPWYSYRFTSTRKNTEFRSASIRSASETRRQPPQNMASSNNNAFDQVMRNSYTSRRQNTYNLFAIGNFNQFSNRAWNGGNPGQFVSVESVHDEVHVAAGGNYGHMTYVEYSAFDPVFFLHHCNIDRLVAMYQAVRPGLVVQPQQMSPTFARPNFNPNVADTIDTPLNPFRRSDGAYFTSRDVSSAGSIWNLNYAYPEVPVAYRGQSAAALQSYTRSRVAALYGPSGSGARKREITYGANQQTAPSRREWLVFVKFNTKQFNGNKQILFFLGDLPGDIAARKTAAIGSASGFASTVMDMDKDVTHTVPLTELMIQRGIALDLETAVPFLKQNLKWCILSETTEIPADQIPSLFIGVSSTEAQYIDGLPAFGEWVHSVDITQYLPGGFTKADDPLVEGTIAKAVPIVGEIVSKVESALPKPSGFVPKTKAGEFINDLINKGKKNFGDVLDKHNGRHSGDDSDEEEGRHGDRKDRDD